MPTALKVSQMWELLGKTEEDMDKEFRPLPTMETTVKALKPSDQSDQYKRYTEYLNLLSDAVHKKLGGSEKICFFDRHDNPPKDHPTGTASRPDFLAMKLPVGESTPSEFYWSALEATGELLSGNNKEKSRAKTAAYTSFLLQARPDMLRVQGIYVDSSGFKLIVSNACGTFDTEHLDWKSRPFRLLLCAWIWRLYEPVVDPSITVNLEQGKRPTFDITVSGVTYQNYTIHSAGLPLVDYIETFRRFEEIIILIKIHEKGPFPGVVRLKQTVGSSEEKKLIAKGGESERKKTRVILLDKAPSIMDAKTPREALIAMYDLLEITRFLYKKRKILHRDISCNNVLLRDVAPPAWSSTDNDLLAPVVPVNTSADDVLFDRVLANTSVDKDPPTLVPEKQSIAEELQEMCFASYLLREKCNSSPGRLDTGVLLIDFDMSEDQEPGNQGDGKKTPHSRMGTPIFIARAVVSGMKKEGGYTLMPLPKLDRENGAYKAYEDAVSDRLQAFLSNEQEYYWIESDIPLKPFKHKLQYDAESVFWLLLYWAILACPVEDTSSAHTKINAKHWADLTGDQNVDTDPRESFVRGFFPKHLVHPVYQPLETLLKAMAQQLGGDHEEGRDQSRKQPDYLHEVFQRLIFGFLFTNYDEPFMTAQKGPDFREPVKVPAMEGPLSPNRIDTKRASKSHSHGGPLEPRSNPSRPSRSNPSLPSLINSSLPSHSSPSPSSHSSRKRSHSDDPNDTDFVLNHAQKRHK